MKKGKQWITRVAAVLLTLCLLSGALCAGVRAQEAPAGTVALTMTPGIQASEPLVAGEVLRLDVAAQCGVPVYSNSTVICYDPNYFIPCDAAGNPVTAVIQGVGIETYLTLNPAHPMVQSGTAFGRLNADGGAEYAMVQLSVPYDLVNKPVAGTPAAETPWFTCYFKAVQPTNGGTASIFMPEGALRSHPGNPNGAMYYSTAPGGDGWTNVSVTLPQALNYSIEASAVNPVTVRFSAGEHGKLVGDIASVRNIEQGTALSDQIALRWAETEADYGYYLAGWAYADDPEQTILPGDTPLIPAAGSEQPEIALKAVFLPRPVSVQLYLLDLRRAEGQQEVNVGDPFVIAVLTDYSAAVLPWEASVSDLAEPLDPEAGYFLEFFAPAQANNYYIVPETDESELRVEIARIHRGTWFVDYLPGASNVENMPERQAKQAGASVKIAAAPTRKGYRFLGWLGNNVLHAPGAAYSEDKDLTMTAMWEKNPAPVVTNGTSLTLQYKSSVELKLDTRAPGKPTWKSSNASVASVDQNSGVVTGKKTGSAVITGTDGHGISATINVTVKYVWWQWLIVIFLFGWIWY